MNKVLKFGLGLGLVLLGCGELVAQKYDNTWLWGRVVNDTTYSLNGNGNGDFKGDSLNISTTFRNMAFSGTSCSVSDEEGELQFYTNGMWIMDTSRQIIQSGDSLNYGSQWNADYANAVAGYSGYSGIYGHVAVPSPSHDSSWYIFHENIQDGAPFAADVCITKVIKSGTAYIVSTKNRKISGVNPIFGNFACCKHGNGRDWWFFFVEKNSNCVHKYLLTSDTLEYVGVQCLGDSVFDGELGKATFSMDGTRFFHSASYSGIKAFDFDRCSGELSNYKWTGPIIEKDSFGTTLDGVWGAEISPNGRFIYASTPYFIYQYDLMAQDFRFSKDTIAANDFREDTGIAGTYAFLSVQNAPDGKMYITPTISQRFLSSINNPNGKGDSCDFRLRNILLPKHITKSPTLYPNYRLGREIGSACDTIYSDIKPIYTQAPWLKVFPNPATDEVQFDYNWIEWEKMEDLKLKIEDLSGRIVMEISVPKYSTRQSFSVKGLVAGVYLVSLRGGSPLGVRGLGSRVLATCKLVKQ